MVSPRCSDLEYINFLIASSQVFTCTEASQCHPLSEDGPAHDAYTRLLLRQPPDTEALWNEVEKNIDRKAGFLVLDDSTLDKPYSKKMDLVCRHWSGKHHKVVRGINLLTLVWTDGNGIIPVDFRLSSFPFAPPRLSVSHGAAAGWNVRITSDPSARIMKLTT